MAHSVGGSELGAGTWRGHSEASHERQGKDGSSGASSSFHQAVTIMISSNLTTFQGSSFKYHRYMN